jgi:hypothetical protein
MGNTFSKLGVNHQKENLLSELWHRLGVQFNSDLEKPRIRMLDNNLENLETQRTGKEEDCCKPLSLELDQWGIKFGKSWQSEESLYRYPFLSWNKYFQPLATYHIILLFGWLIDWLLLLLLLLQSFVVTLFCTCVVPIWGWFSILRSYVLPCLQSSWPCVC